MKFRTAIIDGHFDQNLYCVDGLIHYSLDRLSKDKYKLYYDFSLPALEFNRRTKSDKYEIVKVKFSVELHRQEKETNIPVYIKGVREQLFHGFITTWLDDLTFNGMKSTEDILAHLIQGPRTYDISAITVSTEILTSNEKPNKCYNGYKIKRLSRNHILKGIN